MILPQKPRVLIATKPVEFCKGMDGLAALVAAELRLEPFLCVG
jgi:transposase